VVAEHDVEGSF